MVLPKDKWTGEIREIRPRLERLFYKGDIDLLLNNTPRLAIVGSRRVTEYGSRVLEKWMPMIVERGITVVSGFMYGVDQKAHEECLRCGGKTVGVLGWGIDKKPVSEDEYLYQKIIEVNSLIVSEYEGEHPADRWTFPARNRIVVGVADAVLVVEAAEKSGSLITAHLAVASGKPLLAVPGTIFSRVSMGTNSLIKEGKAVSALSVEDVLEVMGLGGGQIKHSFKNEENDGVLSALEDGGKSFDELVRVLGLSVAEVTEKIFELQVEGKVEEREGKLVWVRR